MKKEAKEEVRHQREYHQHEIHLFSLLANSLNQTSGWLAPQQLPTCSPWSTTWSSSPFTPDYDDQW